MKAHDRITVRAAVAAAVLAISLAAGCSSSKSPSAPTSPVAGSGSAATGYSATYSATDTSGGDLGLSFDTVRVLTDGGSKVRFTAGNPGGPFEVTDGVQAMVPNENGDGYHVAKPSDIGRFVVHDSGTPSTWCANAKEVAATNVLNRATRHYTCKPVNLDADPGFFVADEISVDKESGLILKWSQGELRVTATEIDLHAALPADAFAMPIAPATSGPKGQSIPTFQIPLIGGGSLTDTTYRGAAVVFLAGDAKSIRALTTRMAPFTNGGKAPQVVGLWFYDDFKGLKGSLTNPADVAAWAKQISAGAGKFDVPVGIDFKGNVAGQMTGTFYPDNRHAAAILTDSTGIQVKIVPATASDAEFASAIKDLH